MRQTITFKRAILGVVSIGALGLTLIIYQMGDRRITVELNGRPAAGMELELITRSEAITLDAAGSADLEWGLSEPETDVWFKAATDSVWGLRLPSRGQRTYRLSDTELTREDVSLDWGILQVRNSWTQSGGLKG